MKSIAPSTVGPITLDEAAKWTANWRSAASAFDFNLKGFTVDVNEILTILGIKSDQQLLTQQIRFYLAINTDDENFNKGFHLVFCGVDSSTGNDLLHPLKPDQQVVFDLTNPCPPVCGNDNCLNSDAFQKLKVSQKR
jgi:hypothetical protein